MGDQNAEVELHAGPVRFSARISVTAEGLLAIGALVSGVLLSTAAIVWASTAMAREHPLATRIRPR